MSSIQDYGGADRLQTLATEWSDAVRRTLAGRGIAPGSASYLDAANNEIHDRLKDLRSDAPHAAALVTILDVLAEDHPQSVRHVFYRMTNPRLPEPVEKTDAGYAQVQDRIVKMRRAGTLPYGWITDATRRGYFVDTFSGTGDFLRRMQGLYRADLWQMADHYVEVWTESRSIAGTIQGDCEELAVSLYPCGGFSSISLAYQAAESINARRDGKPVVIFYIGDFDPAGVLIDVALERELRSHLRADVDMTFTRLGITPAQIETYDLPGKPRKAGDRRALHVRETVEAEAMPAGILRRLLRTEIEALLPADALAVAQVAEESERALIGRISDMLEESRA